MTIYSVKTNNREVIKTCALHEAIKIAKRELIEKLASLNLSITSTSEQMYLHNGRAQYRIYATVWGKRWDGRYMAKTYSKAINIENVPMGGYNFALNKEIVDAVEEAKKKNENC